MASKDYLRFPGQTVPSFHFRVDDESARSVTERIVGGTLASGWGYPQPGVQSPTPQDATAPHYFLDEATWNNIMDHGEFDDVVVGTGFCALAYVTEALKRDPFRKILMLERGDLWLPEHFQNVPLPFKMLLGGPSETFPWTLSYETWKNPSLKFVHGSCPFVGGRSLFWSAWCPRPSMDLMRDFPPSMKATAKRESFWKDAGELLHVIKADEIKDTVFDGLQMCIDRNLRAGLPKIVSAVSSEPAPLAVGNSPNSSLRFNKFSTPAPLLALQDAQRLKAEKKEGNPLMIATNAIVQRLVVQKIDSVNKAVVLETSRGSLCFPKGDTNVILAAGAIPNTTLLLNSLESVRDNAGTRLTGHFLSHIAARFPICDLDKQDNARILNGKLQIAASYVAGLDKVTKKQYHIQVTAIHTFDPEQDAGDAARECPDYAAAATLEQLRGSELYVVLVCATLGEFEEGNANSWVRLNPQATDPTANVTVQMTLTDNDRALWATMDEATYQAIDAMSKFSKGVEFWHNDGGWKDTRPPQEEIRVPGIVHEGSTLYMGAKSAALSAGASKPSVDDSYRPHGTENVYVTGAALFPTAGSWNPTLTMCGYAQDLAQKLVV